MAREPEILPFGPCGVLIRFALQASPEATNAVRAFLAAVRAENIRGVRQTAGSLVSVFVEFIPADTNRMAVETALQSLLRRQDWLSAPNPAPTRRWHIPVAFGGELGPQLEEAADLAGLTATQAVTALCEAEVGVLTIGFAPGQPYIGLLPENWNMPRQNQLTPRVPAGALVVAVRQLVLFNEESTTGWRQVGQTAFRPFFAERQTPILLQAGDAIKFHAVPTAEMMTLITDNPDGLGGAHCEVLS